MKQPDKIICVGKNYSEHAKELGDAVPEKPVLFLKPPSVLRIAQNGEMLSLHLPQDRGSVHHECEIVLQIKKGGYRLNRSEASQALGAVSIGLDMTLRDLQAALKKNGHPWTTSKVFPDAAVVGPWIPIVDFTDVWKAEFSFTLNGKTAQRGNASEMTFSPIDCVKLASEHFPLCDGDLLFTGTPKGVGPVKAGDKAELMFGAVKYSVQWKD